MRRTRSASAHTTHRHQTTSVELLATGVLVTVLLSVLMRLLAA